MLRAATATPARRYLHVSVANRVAGQALIGDAVATTASLLLLWALRFLMFQPVFASKSPRPAPAGSVSP